jgi:hypothetical protein
MFPCIHLGLILTVLLQAVPVPAFPEGVLTPAERSRIEGEKDVNDRIKIYEKASSRIHGNILKAISQEDFRTIPEAVRLWIQLLEGALQDIEADPKPKKKSRPLIRFEIQVRKAIVALKDGKIRTPVDLHDLFDSCIARAGDIHKRLVEILFTP